MRTGREGLQPVEVDLAAGEQSLADRLCGDQKEDPVKMRERWIVTLLGRLETSIVRGDAECRFEVRL